MPLPYERKESGQSLRIVEVRRLVAELAVDLRQRGAAEAALAIRQIEQYERGVAAIEAQQWRQRAARIADRRERRNDQRDGCRHGLFDTTVVPRRSHRQRILADGDRDADRHAE